MPTKVTGKVEAAKRELTVHLPDTRGVTISRWGRGNTKIGMDGVYTYSRLPGRPDGFFEPMAQRKGFKPGTSTGTCPGSSVECESICYAKRVISTPPIWEVWKINSESERLPGDEDPLPDDAKIVRIHVSGDFSSVEYIEDWIALADGRPEVDFFGYTRSWRVADLLESLEKFRALPNVQLFASMDKSMRELPPKGWRRAWIENDPRCNLTGADMQEEANSNTLTLEPDGQDGVGYVCPEEMGRKPNCQSCMYCVTGQRGDVIFLLH